MTATQATLFEATGIDLATPPAKLYNQNYQTTLTDYNAAMALGSAVKNWGHLSDLQKTSALLAAYNSASTSGQTVTDASGNTTPATSAGTLTGQAAAVLGLYSAAQTLGQWDKMSDMQRAQSLSGFLSSGSAALQNFGVSTGSFGTSMGQIGAGLAFANALQGGHGGAIITSGLQFANSFNGAADQIISNWVKIKILQQNGGLAPAWQVFWDNASPNIWGLTPKESQTLQVANQGATGSVPNWLGRVAERPMGVSVVGLPATQMANDATWRIAA